MKRLTDEVVGNFNFGKITAQRCLANISDSTFSKLCGFIIEDFRPELHETHSQKRWFNRRSRSNNWIVGVASFFQNLTELEIVSTPGRGDQVVCVLSPILLATCWTDKGVARHCVLILEYAGG